LIEWRAKWRWSPPRSSGSTDVRPDVPCPLLGVSLGQDSLPSVGADPVGPDCLGPALLAGEQVLPDEVRGFRHTDPASRKVGDEVVCLGLANHSDVFFDGRSLGGQVREQFVVAEFGALGSHGCFKGSRVL
jgi:hypothetical protein